MLDACRMIVGPRPVFVLASITADQAVLWTAAGEMRAVVKEGICEVDRRAGVRVPTFSRVIVSPGGHPQDESLYNAQRGMELAKNCVRDGGEALLLAACSRGVAPTDKARQNFYARLTAPLPRVLEGLRERYVLYSHKAHKFAELLQRLEALHLHSELPEETVRRAHMRPVGSPQAVVDRWLKEDDEPILVVRGANKVALYPA
jgi:nickel-dependent lactate racemase